MSSSFIWSESQSLKEIDLEVRDSIGFLAVQILSQRDDFKKMDKRTMLLELRAIIKELQDAYESNGDYDD